MRITIIGAGPGGYETAVEAAKQGLDVTLITDGPLGGTCLNEGCIPTKVFCHDSEEGRKYADALANKEEVIQGLRKGVAYLLKNPHISIVEGKASFIDAHTVQVNGEQYCSDKVIIATGSHSAILPIPGADGENVITSTELLNLENVPETLTVIGGGVIGMEMACYMNRFGSDVTVLEYLPEILPNIDREVAAKLRSILRKKGIKCELGKAVTEIPQDAEKVLMAVGRIPNVEGLNLEAAGIVYNKKGIEVNDNMQTSMPDVYAIGDVNGRLMLAHVATYQGRRALNHILGKSDRIRFDIVPSAVFTTPEVASVGLSQEACDDQELDYTVKKSFYMANGKAVSMGEKDGFCKLIINNEDNTIIGCHIIGAHASDLVHEVSILMNAGVAVDEAKDMIFAHPTLSEIIQSVIR